MSKKQRSAKREVRRLEVEVAELRARIKNAELHKISTEMKLDDVNRLNQRLSQTEMRTKINKDGQIYQVNVNITEAMLTEFRLGRRACVELIADQIGFELQQVAMNRAGTQGRPYNED